MEQENQPLPKFTLDDLLHKLDEINLAYVEEQKDTAILYKDSVKAQMHELYGIITRHKTKLESIDPAMDMAAHEKIIADAIGTEKIQFYVAGVQLIEDGILQGTSLYSTMIKAKGIRDIMNRKFAELRVQHEAKILQYPVY